MPKTLKVNLLNFGVIGPTGDHHHVDANPHEFDEAFARELVETDRAEVYDEKVAAARKKAAAGPTATTTGDPAVGQTR